MAATLFASEAGLKIFEQARRLKGWNKTASGKNLHWPPTINKSTLERFHQRKPIQYENFVTICEAVGVEWQTIIDQEDNISSIEIIDQSAPTELNIFSQQIFDWFAALRFEIEGFPKCDDDYVEVIVRVLARSGFDRILVKIITYEVGLTDLDVFRQVVMEPRRQVDGGWLVTKSWVSQAVKDALKKLGDRRLTCLTFDELIDQDANFTPYLEWLEREIKKREIDRYYVDLGCTKGEFDGDTRTLRGTSKYSVADGGIDLYIDKWLENPVKEHVSILGEFGTGKTWFALHYAGKCLQAYQVAKSKGMPRPRLPLVIPLRDYAKALDVENVLAGFFYTQHNIRLNSDVFDRLNRMGKLLLIFDGFDEMADKIDTQKMTDNFWELAKVVTPNAKVILTCRTEHFPRGKDERENLSGERLPSTANKIAVAPKFETLELMKFDDEQIREVLARRTSLATVELVMANAQLLDLLRRAVMAEFVLEALPEIEANKPIDLARVYLYAVRHKMERDITTGRTFTSLADKLYFLCELAWEMLSEDKMTLNYREFPGRLRSLFGEEVESQKHLDHWHYDMMGQTMLIRNDDGDYSPAHRSLLEFFVAYKFAAELGLLAADFLVVAQAQSGIDESLTPGFYTWSDYWRRELDDKGDRKSIAPLAGFKSESPDRLRKTFGKSPLTKAILDLLLPSLNNQPNFFLNWIKSTRDFEDGYLGGNAATVLANQNPYELDYQDLSSTNLAYADLTNASLRETTLSKANLENCITEIVFDVVNVIIMSKDEQKLITAHRDKTIIIWDRTSGRELQRLIEHHVNINCLELSVDGQLLYSGSSDGTIKEWRLADGVCQKTFDGQQKSVRFISLSSDEKELYSAGSDGTIKTWRLADGICLNSLQIYESHNLENTTFINVSKDGIICLGGMNGTVKVQTLSDPNYCKTFYSNDRWVGSIALSQNRQFIYVGHSNGVIREWSLSDCSNKHTFIGHTGAVEVIVIDENRQMLYSGSHDRTIKEWTLSDGICQRTFEGHQERLNTIMVSGDGKFLYSGGADRMIKKWNLLSGICDRTFDGTRISIHAVTINMKGDIIYSGNEDGTIKEWNISDRVYCRSIAKYKSTVRSIVLSSDNKFIYSGHDDGSINEWSISDGNCKRTFHGHEKSVDAISISKDGQFVYSGGGDDKIREWKLSDGSYRDIVTDFKTVLVRAKTLSRNGEYCYFGKSDNTITGLKITARYQSVTFTGHEKWVSVIALSQDSKFLYSGSVDLTIKKWDLLTGKCLHTFTGHENTVNALSLNHDEQLLYSSSIDGTIKEWDVVTGECLRTIDTRLCAGANITNVKGLTPAQTNSLIALGAIDHSK